MVTRPRLWLKTTSEKGPHLSCVVFTKRPRDVAEEKVAPGPGDPDHLPKSKQNKA